jgi:hypothetical protein
MGIVASPNCPGKSHSARNMHVISEAAIVVDYCSVIHDYVVSE